MKHTTFIILIAIFCFGDVLPAYSQKKTPELIATITMPDVTGRIDHLAIDRQHQILFVAALGNNTVEVVDLKGGKVIHTIRNLNKPQGVAFIQESNVVIVANGDTGACDIFNAKTLEKVTSVKLPGDADNVRVDPVEKKIYVGFADGGIAIIDATSYKLLSEIRLSGHPESFQLDKTSKRIFVNVPDSEQVEIIDLKTNSVTARWKMTEAKSNYPMALDERNHRLFVGFRKAPKLLVIDTDSGKTINIQDIDGDVDDLFYNSAARQIYLSCGAGYINVFTQEDQNSYKAEKRIAMRAGARTCLFIAELNQLIVAAPARDGTEAALLVYKLE